MVTEPEASISGRFVPIITEDSPAEVYANVIEATYTPWDFTLKFCIGSSPTQEDAIQARRKKKTEMEIPADCVARVRISTRMAEEIISVLQSQTKKQKQDFPYP